MALFQLGYLLFGLCFIGGLPQRAFVVAFIINMIVPLALPLALLVTKSRAMHYIGLGPLFAAMLWHYAPYAII